MRDFLNIRADLQRAECLIIFAQTPLIMKLLKFILLAALLLLPASFRAAAALENMGTFTTDFNDMVLYRDGNKVTGKWSYYDAEPNGKWNGKVK